MSDRLNTAMRQLADEAKAATPPALPGGLLEAEWEKKFNSVPRPATSAGRTFPWWAVYAAAVIIAAVFLIQRPHRQETRPEVETANILLPPKADPLPSAPPAKRPKAHRSGPRPKPAEPVMTAEAEEPFTPIPFTAPLAPDERADVIRMELPVSALIAAGLPVRVSDPGARAHADLLVGEDGRARAVRLISVSNSYRSIQ